MPFPKSDRVIYNKNPLTTVVCQLRFPSILKIDSEEPTQFQEAIRTAYPFLEVQEQTKIKIPSELARQLQGDDLPLSHVSGKNYSFISRDKSWKVNLTRNFLALSTTNYERWEDFKERLEAPLNALNQIYVPSFFTRVGLRYQNVIVRSKLGITNVSWSNLIQPYISGVLNESSICDNVVTTENRLEIQLADSQSIVKVFYGFVESVDNGETCYQIDSDFFTDQGIETEVGDAINKFEFFNRRSRRLFRWFITESLQKAMDPSQIT